MPIYLTVSATLSGLMSLLIAYLAINDIRGKYEDLVEILEFSLVGVFFISAISSAIYAMIKLQSPGISSHVRKLVLRRHIITVTFFGLANMYFLVSMIEFFVLGA